MVCNPNHVTLTFSNFNFISVPDAPADVNLITQGQELTESNMFIFDLVIKAPVVAKVTHNLQMWKCGML